MLDATEENDFENTIEVFLKGTVMVVETEDRSDRESVSWENFSKVRRLLVVQHLESSGSNFELNSLANREPVQVNQNRCDATVTKFLSNNTGKGILNKLKAGQI